MGDYDGAVASYQACMRDAPDFGETYWSLANLKTYRFDDATVSEYGEGPPLPRANVQSVSTSCLPSARRYEDRGDYERAWDHYRRGNETQRAQ